MSADKPAVAPSSGNVVKIAIVGRPNVGKSTLFNRLVGKRLAIVDDTPGVTRDRREGDARLGGFSFIAIDTPGLEEAPEAALEGRMRQQTVRAIDDAVATIFVIDARVGVTPVNLPGAEIFTALQSGAIDATEWVGPYNDLAFGLHRITKLCYYPGWHEPGSVLECMVNKEAFEALPEDLQAIVATCCQSINNDMLAEFSARNQQAMKTLVEEHGVEFRPLPDDVLAALKTATNETLAGIAASDPFAAKVLEAYQSFQQAAQAYTRVSEGAYLAARAGA